MTSLINRRQVTPGQRAGAGPFALGIDGGVASAPAFTLAQLPAGSWWRYDARANVTLVGASKVSSWMESTSTYAYTAATTAMQPTFVADGFDVGFPLISANGAASGNIMSGNQPLLEKEWVFIVGRRANANQQGTANSKVIYRSARLSDGRSRQLHMLRATNDPDQSSVYMLGPGAAGSPVSLALLPKDGKAIIGMRSDGQENRLYINGTQSGLAPTGTTSTDTQRWLFGTNEAAETKAAFGATCKDIIDVSKLPGEGEQLANWWLIEGALHWEFGLQGQLRADHPFKNSRPLASDWTGNNRCIIGLGNSLVYGPMTQMATAYGAAARGVTTENAGVSGNKPEQIWARFLAFTPAQLRKIFFAGPGWENPGDGSVNFDTAYFDIINAVEAAHGRGAGNAHIIATGRWIGFIDGQTEIGSPLRATINAYNATVAAAFPNYYWDGFGYMVSLGRPGGKYEDAVAYAKGWVPSVLRQGYVAPPGVSTLDTLHLNTLGQLEFALGMVAEFIEPKGWGK